MKTILFCNLIPRKTGAFERFLELLGTEFARNGDSLLLILAGDPILPVAESWRKAGVRWTVLQGWSDACGHEHPWRMTLPALRLVRREKPDIAAVHFGNEIPSLTACLLARATGMWDVRWVWEQDQQIADPKLFSARVSRLRALNLAFQHFVAVYEDGRRSMMLRGVPSSRIAVIHNSVGGHVPTASREALRAGLGVPSQATLLLTVGSLIPRKRIDFTIRALGALLRSDGSTFLAIAGDGPSREELEGIARSEVPDGRIRFLGLRNDVRDLQAASDVYVHASLAETCTYAVTESMAAGIPAVVTEAGAHREQIVDGESGYVVKADDAAGFAARVAELAAHPDRRAAMGRKAIERWQSNFRVEIQAAAYHALYRRIARIA